MRRQGSATPGEVGQREVARGCQLLADAGFELARAAGGMQRQRFLGGNAGGCGVAVGQSVVLPWGSRWVQLR
jgi:hypothetical protein